MLPPIDISLTLMVTWDNSFQYQNICNAHKNKREDFRQLASFLYVWTTCFGRSCRLQKLFCIDTDFTEQAFLHVERHAFEILIIEIWWIHPSFSSAVWNIWSRKWIFSVGKRKTPFQRVVFKISRPFIFWLSWWSSISEASIQGNLKHLMRF